MTTPRKSTLARAKNPMPSSVKKALIDAGLMAAYNERPAYQKNDYLGWIGQAKRDETKRKRLEQMLRELKGGTKYMNMPWQKSAD
jgi:uncharacterized protein YdeI (YjbR/CyaY-like superfamily)